MKYGSSNSIEKLLSSYLDILCKMSAAFLAACLPVFVEGLKDVETVQGKRIAFECTVNATPKPDVAW